ncbi:MAG: sulfotransferase [Candidatus Omnitrophica bacterium]|nr:sulfotransferase [Candidatus Omnitrophota bacterium]
MGKEFKLLMLGAMYENGGNTTHRFLDGHPQMCVYPFESQLGSRLVVDQMSTLFPQKYRWPVFPLDGTAYGDYKLIIDEEGKVRSRTPQVSKFRHEPFDMSDDERCEIYQKYIARLGRSRAHNIEAFFRSTFDAWKDFNRTGSEQFYVGYSPVLVVDADKILNDVPGAHFLHVVRNPWAAYADTKKRPVPLSLENYMFCWNINQYFALLWKKKFPARFHLIRIEDVLAGPQKTLGALCRKLGLKTSETLGRVSWNGKVLEEVYPWGTIRKPTAEANLKTAQELSKAEIREIGERTWQYLDVFGYKDFLK